MLVLALDTTGPHCAAAVARDGHVLAHISERIGRGHAERLAPMVMEVLATAGAEAPSIDRLAVCTGPGSFTGLRVALSYAKGFALPRRLPIVGVDALGLTYMGSGTAPDFGTVWADIRRGDVMFGDYAGPGPMVHNHPRIGTPDERDAHAALMQFELMEAGIPDVALLARIAGDLDPAHYPAVPLYARAPDAKLPGGVSL